MLRYTIKRILLMPILLLIVALLIYLLLNLNGADPLQNMLPQEYTQEQYDALAAKYGLDKPILVQYFNWIKGILHGDLGISYKTRGPVGDDVFYRIPISLKVALITTAIMLLIGLPVGVMCAVKQYTAFDDITNVVSKFLGAVPSFWLGLMLMIWFSVGLGWFPTYGIKEGAKSYVLPIFTLLLPFLAQFIRQVRSAMLDCIRQDYVRTARAKGASERRVIFHEALKNAMLPIITFAGGCFASMIGGAVTVEKLFAIPGIGYKVVEAINTRDIPTMLACVMFLSILTIVVQLLIDLSYAFIDPRVRSTFVSVKKKKAPKKAEEVKAA